MLHGTPLTELVVLLPSNTRIYGHEESYRSMDQFTIVASSMYSELLEVPPSSSSYIRYSSCVFALVLSMVLM